VAWSPDGGTLASAGADGTVRLWSPAQAALLASLSAVGDATLACTSGGFYALALGSEEPERARLALRHPVGRTELYLPLGGLHEILHRPDKVAAALAGDLSGDDASSELERLGLGDGVVWRGEQVRLTAGEPPAAAQPDLPERSTGSGPAAVVTRVQLSNYRSIAACDMRLGALTFLCGPNGSGKSNFLDGLRLVADGLRTSLGQALKERGGFQAVLRQAPHRPDRFSIRLEFRLSAEQGGHFACEVRREQEGFSIHSEECEIGKAFYRVVEGKVARTTLQTPPAAMGDRFYLVSASGLPEFRPAFDLLSNMGFYSFNLDRLRGSQVRDAGDLLARDGSNLASVLGRLAQSREGEPKQRIQEYLQGIVPGIEAVDPVFDDGGSKLEFQQRMEGEKDLRSFTALHMSDGTLRALGILVALFQAKVNSRVRVVGIEEPELALHPGAADLLRDALREGSEYAQVIVTSHSPELLDDPSIQDHELLAVESREGRTYISELDEVTRSALRDRLFTAGELMRAGQLLADPMLPGAQEGEP
jgi:predicted ATPase